MKKIILISSLFILAIMVTSCKNTSETKVVDTKKETPMKIVKATDLNGKEYTSAYVCPMYCVGSGLDKPGKCPACKMDLVANPKNAVDHSGHDHSGHDHSGHSH